MEYREELRDACFAAVQNGANTFATVKGAVLKARVIPFGPQDDWPAQFESCLIDLVKLGRIAVTNGKFYVRTGVAPKWDELP